MNDASAPPDAVTLARQVRGGEGLALRVVGEGLVDLFALPAAGDVVIGRGEWADVSPGEVIDLGSVMLILMRGDAETAAPAPQRGGPGAPGAMARAGRLLERVAPGDISVLIQGETGVGKEGARRAPPRPIEARGPRCSASTAAASPRPCSTASCSATRRARSRVLQDRKVQRIGALEPWAIDIRFISATNRDRRGARGERGNQPRAAQELGISRGTLLSRLKQYGITRPRG